MDCGGRATFDSTVAALQVLGKVLPLTIRWVPGLGPGISPASGRGPFKFSVFVSYRWAFQASPRAGSVGPRVFPRAANPGGLLGRSVPAGRSRLGAFRRRLEWDEPGLSLVSQKPVAAALWVYLLPPELGLCMVGRFPAGPGLARGIPPPSW